MKLFSITRQLFVDFYLHSTNFFFSEIPRNMSEKEISELKQEVQIYLNDDLCVV